MCVCIPPDPTPPHKHTHMKDTDGHGSWSPERLHVWLGGWVGVGVGVVLGMCWRQVLGTGAGAAPVCGH
jgi:hypothetical protein